MRLPALFTRAREVVEWRLVYIGHSDSGLFSQRAYTSHSTASTVNHSTITGPNRRATWCVPSCWNRNKPVMTTSVIGMI